MNAQFNTKGREGFTLVELLVTILIIIILAVAALPLLKPFVTKAQYSAEGVPVVGNIRTKVELYRIENNHLPGIPVNLESGKMITASGEDYATSYITTGPACGVITAVSNGVHSLEMADTVNTLNSKERYLIDGNDVSTDDTLLAFHAWKNIDIGYSDLLGRRLRPQHVQFLVLESNEDHYYWVVACFGDGTGLAKGCGYAVLEYNNPEKQRKIVATFELYKAKSNTQLHFCPNTSADELQGDVYLPTAADLDSDQDASYQGFLSALRTHGWSF